jgi:hypothetical protein
MQNISMWFDQIFLGFRIVFNVHGRHTLCTF